MHSVFPYSISSLNQLASQKLPIQEFDYLYLNIGKNIHVKNALDTTNATFILHAEIFLSIYFIKAKIEIKYQNIEAYNILCNCWN